MALDSRPLPEVAEKGGRCVSAYEHLQEWVWRHSAHSGLTRYVLLAFTRSMHWTPRGYETAPMQLQEIISATGLAESTVRTHLRALADPILGELAICADRRGLARYRLRPQIAPPPSIRVVIHHGRCGGVVLLARRRATGRGDWMRRERSVPARFAERRGPSVELRHGYE